MALGAQAKDEAAPEPEKKKDVVKLATLQGPTIQSHPWEKMLSGRKPDVGTLAFCVPEDFYFP